LVKNKPKVKLKATDILGKKVLILGESGSGKTRLAAKLVEELMAIGGPGKMTIIDFAPKRTDHVGGRLKDYVTLAHELKYLAPRSVYTPRLAGSSPQQVLRFARLNRKLMEPLLNEFAQNPSEVLILNDLTLYLHEGKIEEVLQCVRLAKTFLGTAYYGTGLGEDLGTGLSRREKQLTDELAFSMDQVIRID
jgi:GTPase SAR1 family protein